MALRELIAEFGIAVDDKDLKQVDQTLAGLVGKVKEFATVAGAYFIGRGIVQMVLGVQELGDNLDDTAQRLGITTDALQEWSYVAKLSGIEADAVSQAFVLLQRNAAAAAGGSKEQAAAFAKLGVSVRDARGQIKDAPTLLTEIAGNFDRVQGQTERTALALDIFGRSGAMLLPVLNKGADGIATLRQEFRDLGGGLSGETVEAAADLGDAMDRLDVAVLSLKGQIVRFLLPAFEWLVDKGTKAVAQFRKLIANTNIVKAAFAVLGVAVAALAVKMVVAFAAPIATIAAIAAGIGLLILIVDDLITLFDGGESVIGDFVDAMFGMGAANEVVLFLKDSWQSLIDMVESGIQLFREAKNAMGSALNVVGLGWDETEVPETSQQKREAAEMQEDARFRADQMRRERLRSSPLDDIGRPGRLLLRPSPRTQRQPVGMQVVAAPASISAPGAAGEGASGGGSVNQTNNITINAANANAREVAEIIERRKAAEMKRTLSALAPQGT